MATIRDVAELAGVSIASVSRIINNDPGYKVLPETRERVWNAVRELDYTPNPNYKKRKTSQISIGCISRLTVEQTEDRYYSTILKGAREFLNRQNYDFDFVASQFDVSAQDNFLTLFSRTPKGLILMDQPNDDTMAYLLSKIKYIVGVDSGKPQIDNICYDRFATGCKAMQYLIDKGHKKIAYIGAHISENSVNVGRYEAYLRTLRKYRLPIVPEWIIDSVWQQEICFEKTIALMKQNNRPTAIFASSDHMAIAALSALHSLGIAIPQEISVIGITDIEDSKYTNPPLTTITIPQKEIGEIAASVLLQRMNGDHSLPKTIIVPTELVERNSVREIL